MKKHWYIGVLKEKDKGKDGILTTVKPRTKHFWFKFGIGPFPTMIAAIRHARELNLKI